MKVKTQYDGTKSSFCRFSRIEFFFKISLFFPSCVTYQQSVGAYAIFFAWINLVLFIRKIPKFGIYIVMFGFVTRTFIQFFLVFVLLIIAFAFGFYILLADSTEVYFLKSVVTFCCFLKGLA